MAKTPIAGLLRIGWDTVGRIVSAQTTSTTTGSAGWSRSAATRSATAAD
jgi:hypothetical protein